MSHPPLGAGQKKAYSPAQSVHSTGHIFPSMVLILSSPNPAWQKQGQDRSGLTILKLQQPLAWQTLRSLQFLASCPPLPGPAHMPHPSAGLAGELTWGWAPAPPPPPKVPRGIFPTFLLEPVTSPAFLFSRGTKSWTSPKVWTSLVTSGSYCLLIKGEMISEVVFQANKRRCCPHLLKHFKT
jgi:hypothetical protein